jgi:hypothetical protein
MPNDEIPDDATIAISAGELDQLFHEIYKRSEPNIGQLQYKNAYESGWEDGAKKLHRDIVENADILIE